MSWIDCYNLAYGFNGTVFHLKIVDTLVQDEYTLVVGSAESTYDGWIVGMIWAFWTLASTSDLYPLLSSIISLYGFCQSTGYPCGGTS